MNHRIILTCLTAAFLATQAQAQVPAAPTNLAATRSTLSPLSGVYQVNIIWQDSSTNVNSYEVQRKEWSSGDWASLGNIGNYDTNSGIGLKAGTQYFYRVRGLNSAGASPFSNIANVTTAAVPASIFLEAEQAQLAGPAVGSNGTGYTGTGYLDFIGPINEQALLRPELPQAGIYRVEFRYSNGGTNNRPLEVKVNDVVVAASLAFPPTGSWSTWSIASVTTSFAFDDTFLVLRSLGSSGANIDSVRFVPVFTGARINFQPTGVPVPAGYVADTGAAYGNRGNGLTYGWNATNSANTRDRNSALSPDQRYDTLARTQNGGDFFWELAVPNGRYAVTLTSGDPSFTDSVYAASIEGSVTIPVTPNSNLLWTEEFRSVNVTDGRLTIRNAPGAANNKFAFIEVYPRHPQTTLFNDDFNGTTLDPSWDSFAFDVLNGAARSVHSASLEKTITTFQTDYVIETKAKGFFAIDGSPSNDFRIIFGQATGQAGYYELRMYEGGTVGLYRYDSATPGTEGTTQTLDSVPLQLPSSTYLTWKIVRDGGTGRIQVYLNQGAGYGATPLLDAVDQTYPYLGRIGWRRATEAQDYEFLVDWFKVSAIPD